MLLAVNYHHIHPPEKVLSWGTGLDAECFREQVEWLQRHFELIGLPELMTALDGGSLPEKACLITFDDGLRGQYEAALPVLERHRAPAAFFVSTMPLTEKHAAGVHKGQYVRSRISSHELFDRAVRHCRELGFRIPEVSREDIGEHYRYDPLPEARIKYLLNYVLPAEVRQRTIDHFFLDLVDDEAAFCRRWYMEKAQIRELHRRFSAVGGHAHSHEPLAGMPRISADRELSRSKAILETVTGGIVDALSYPLGNPRAVGLRESISAERAGYRCAFTMERALNHSLARPHLLARIDCNDLPEIGKRPMFRVRGGVFETLDGGSGGRKRYFHESSD